MGIVSIGIRFRVKYARGNTRLPRLMDRETPRGGKTVSRCIPVYGRLLEMFSKADMRLCDFDGGACTGNGIIHPIPLRYTKAPFPEPGSRADAAQRDGRALRSRASTSICLRKSGEGRRSRA